MASAKKTPKKKTSKESLPWTGWAGIGALVAALIALVVWSLPREGGGGEAGAGSTGSGAGTGIEETATDAGTTKTTGSVERLPEATCELAVLTDKSEEEVQALATPEAIGKLLDVRFCGATCDAVKKSFAEGERFDLDTMKSEDFILPPPESFEAIAPGLTAQERDRAAKAPTTLVVRTRFPPSIDQPGARACFAATAAAAQALGGFVYDEAGRRIETAAQFAEHLATAPLGKSIFVPRMITVQLYRQDDGTARLLTLGMARFGSPDFIARGATMGDAPRIAYVVNAVAAKMAAMKSELPFVVTLDEAATVSGRRAAELVKDPSSSKPVSIETVDAERVEGDPDNEIVELIPPGGANAEGWSAVLTSLFGGTPSVVRAADDAALAAIAARAKKDLPAAIKRKQAGEGSLFVKGPFDAGTAGTEWMWIEVTSCDKTACSGILSNDPGYASNLAAGRPASVARDKTADWLLRLKDGGTAGGESIRALTEQAKP